MPIVSVRRAWDRQPPAGTQLNTDNQLTAGVIDAYVFRESLVTRSLVSAAYGTLDASSNGIVGTSRGLAHFTKSAGYGGYGINFTNATALPSNNFTVLVVYEGSLDSGTGFPAPLYGAWGSGGLSGQSGYIGFISSSGSLSTIAPSATGIHAISGDYGGTAYNYTVDGQPAGSFTSATYTAGGVPTVCGYLGGYAGLNIKVLAIVAWGRRLSIAEQMAATANPWQLFA